jgi:parvulin-like peptidyl-prolyl isomerase
MPGRLLCAALLVLGLCTGCKSLTKKHDNPVMAAAPRRSTLDDTEIERRLAQAEEKPGSPAIQQVGDSSSPEDDEIFNARVLARVNGAPVFAGDVLERYGEYLQKAREKLPPSEYHQLRQTIIQRDLRGHIERRLLAERMKSKLKPDQIKSLETHVDRLFDADIEKLKRDLKVSTRTELELELNKRGTTIAAVRDNFATQRLAVEYLGSSIEKPPLPSRQEMVDYYHEHLDEYALPGQVRWEQIQVTWEPPLTKSDAHEKLEQALEQLKTGRAWKDVASEFSDGPTASKGGQWDWMEAGSLADTKLEKELFRMPIGQLNPFEGERAYHLVRVLERRAAGHKSFQDVQLEIQEAIMNQRQGDLPKQFVENLVREAIIETEYDLGPEA